MSNVLTPTKHAEMLKNQGNEYFMKHKFGAAIDMYTEAIALCPTVPVYWTNRAVCYRKRNEWEKVEEDCTRALQLDKQSVKAHFMLGLALLHRKENAVAIFELEKALILARDGGGGSMAMAEDIWQELSNVKFSRWEAEAAVRGQRIAELRLQCERLMREDGDRACQALATMAGSGKLSNPHSGASSAVCGPAHAHGNAGGFRNGITHWLGLGRGALGGEGEDPCGGGVPVWKHTTGGGVSDDGQLHSGDGRGNDDDDGHFGGGVRGGGEDVVKLESIRHETDERIALLRAVFAVAEERDCPGEVPDHLCCKLTMEIFRDPVITPSGITYERATLLEHLRKVGKFDPVTRAPLDAEQLVPNLALKEAVQLYLANHGWAYRL